LTRTKRIAGLVGALSIATAISVSGLAAADSVEQNGVSQYVTLDISPTKLPKKHDKKKPKAVSLFTEVGISSDDPINKVPSANKVVLTYDKDIKFNRKGVATCDENSIATLNNEQAKSECKDSLVGTGAATATCGPSEDPPDIPGVKVAAFNTPNGIVLHSDANLGGNSTITLIPGNLKGQEITFTVPPLAGGACSIVTFNATLGKGQVDKKYKNYISGACKDKQLTVDGVFTYNSNPQGVSSLAPSDALDCTQKK
jgi:hypothetical protein